MMAGYWYTDTSLPRFRAVSLDFENFGGSMSSARPKFFTMRSPLIRARRGAILWRPGLDNFERSYSSAGYIGPRHFSIILFFSDIRKI